MTFEEWNRGSSIVTTTSCLHHRAYDARCGYCWSNAAWDASRAAALAEVAKWHEDMADKADDDHSNVCAAVHRVAAAHFREIGGGA